MGISGRHSKMRAVVIMTGMLLLVAFTDAYGYNSGHYNECVFRGTAPFCNGKCDDTMTWRAGCKSSHGCRKPGYLRFYFVNQWRWLMRDFGKPCWTGTKKLCCKGPGP